jgi:hypothetical protein
MISRFAFAASTIVAHEEVKYFLRDGKMEKYEGHLEYTYFLDLEKNQLIRTRIYDYQTKKITPDETVYQIQSQLNSHPFNADRYGVTPSIRAFGQPDADTSELLVIKNDVVESMVSSPRSVIVSHFKRLK